MLMRQSTALLFAAAATTVRGFEQTSPFFMVASQALESPAFTSQQIATAQDVETQVLKSLRDCAQQYYFVVEQPGLTAGDIRDEASLPRIRERVAKSGATGMVEVPEVIGNVDAVRLVEKISEQCDVPIVGASLSDDNLVPVSVQAASAVVRLQGQSIADGKKRAEALAVQDARLDRYINNATDHKASYVVIYTSAPATEHEVPPYEMDLPFQPLHTDLKRHMEAKHVRRANGTDDDPQAGLPLFERYQFLSPGIFMGLSVSLVLFLILYVGVSAIANLEVSYMAFSKEMGPQAQKNKAQ